MAATNPWAIKTENGSLGGLRAFVQRQVMTEEASNRFHVTTDQFSSIEIMHLITELSQCKRLLFDQVRELEQLERTIATAACLLPHQLQLKCAAIARLREQLEHLLAMKPLILRTLQKTTASESVDIELQYQRTFIDLFLKIGEELPRYAHVVTSSLGEMNAVTSDLLQRQNEYESMVTNLKVTIAKYQITYDEIHQLRNVYSQLQASICDLPLVTSDTMATNMQNTKP